MSTIIKRNTTVPVKKTERYFTVYDNQTEMNIQVFEGERPMTCDNNKLGNFVLYNIPPMPRKQAKVDVCFDVDADGILNVSAVETSTGNNKKITITNENGRLSLDEIENMIADAEKYKAEDAANKIRAEAKNSLENYCHSLQARIQSYDVSDNMHPHQKRELENEIRNTLNWLDMNHVLDKRECEEKQEALEDFANGIFQTIADRAEAKSSLINYCNLLRARVESAEVRDDIHYHEREELENAIRNTLNWLGRNQFLRMQVYEEKQDKLRDVANLIFRTIADRVAREPAHEVDFPDNEQRWKDRAKVAVKVVLALLVFPFL